MTSTIGSLDLARALYNKVQGGDPYLDVSSPPKGFELIGSGCYRYAYLHKASNVVYKIGHHTVNTSEAYNARMLRRKSTRKLAFELIIPHTRTYVMKRKGSQVLANVIAQEFAPNARFTECQFDYTWEPDVKCTCLQDFCFKDIRDIITDFTGLDDIHSENVLVDDHDRFWLIDLGC